MRSDPDSTGQGARNPDHFNCEESVDRLLEYRARFPILQNTNYLISNSLGAVPAGAADRLHAYYETWATRGVRAWEESWWTMAADMGNLVAPLLGAGNDEVVFQPSVTLAHAVVLSAFDFKGPRRRIVTDALHFPSILYLLGEQRAGGAELVVIPTDDGVSIELDRMLDSIDETTAAVCTSHVLFKSASIQNIHAIGNKARRVGATSVIDGYQSVGTIDVDVKASAIDVYIGGCLKWLCGGPGAAFLWVDPSVRGRLEPCLTGWMADKQPFAFRPELHRREDAWRFLSGTPNISALYAASAGLEIINEIGLEPIRAKSVRQTRRLLELVDRAGYPCTTPRSDEQRGGTVAVDVPHGYEVSRDLKSREILCDFRPGAGVRLSPHFYTRDDELDAAISAISEILETRSWRRFSDRTSAVT